MARLVHFGVLFTIAFSLAGCPGGTSPCETDGDCPGGHVCTVGECVPGCPDGGASCDDAGPRDASVGDAPRDVGDICRNDAACDDGRYCNGTERCAPDAGGCVAGTSPCAAGVECDEEADSCRTTCDEDADGNGRLDADNDGDGHRSIACGASGSVPGDDCDDADADRYPRTLSEVCDPTNPAHDEDCDPCTVADYLANDGDLDGDGFVAGTCSNPLRASDDTATFACPGSVNEFTRIDTETRLVTGNDCDDSPLTGSGINPGVAEICNGIEDNCNDAIDGEDAPLVCDCTIGAAPQRCGMTDVGACAYGAQNCIDGLWGECVGDVDPATEVCNGADDNCDGNTDEGLRVDCYPDSDNDRYQDDNSVSSQCIDTARSAWGGCPTNFVAPGAALGTDCAATNGSAYAYSSWRVDADDDSRCVGSTVSLCRDGSRPAGYRAPSTCTATDDCNDARGDQHTSTPCRRDVDLDNYCWAATETFCGDGSTCPSGFRRPSECLGVDPYDLNRCVWNSSLAAPQYYSCDAGPFSCVPVSSASCGLSCPYGFHLTECYANRRPGSQNGFISTSTVESYGCNMSLTCNGWDSAIARLNLTCEPDVAYGGGCGSR